MQDKVVRRLAHMIDYCDLVEARIESYGMTESTFRSSQDHRDLLLMPLIQIGELSAKIDRQALSNLMPNESWGDICGFRNRIVHAYDLIDYRIAWDVASQDIPKLRARLVSIPEVFGFYKRAKELEKSDQAPLSLEEIVRRKLGGD